MDNGEILLSETRLCCTCMGTGTDFTSIFDLINVSNKEETLNYILLQCTSIQITKTDAFSHCICNVCIERLTNAYLFRKMCLETHDKLHEFYKTNKSVSYFIKLDDNEPQLYETEVIKLAKEYNCEETTDNVGKKVPYLIKLPEQSQLHETKVDIREDVSDNIENVDAEELNLNFNDCASDNNDEEDLQTAGEQQTTFECNVCNKTFQNKYTMNRHKKIHYDFPHLKCNICFKQFTRSYDVKRHMSTHTGDKPYCCHVCHAAFTQSGTLASHMRQHEDFRCDVKKKKKNPEEKPHLCSICGKAFKHSSNLTIHVRRHKGDKPYCCNMCNLRFVSSGRLTSHMRIHTGERPFICNICGKSFAQSSVIAKHIKSHTGVRPHECNYCSKTFSTLYYLNIHKRSHTGEKPHECNVCHKTFADPKNLKQHHKIHSDEKPFLCIMCGKSFRRSHHLKGHMSIHAKT